MRAVLLVRFLLLDYRLHFTHRFFRPSDSGETGKRIQATA